MVFQRELKLRTNNSGEMHDLTGEVSRIVSESGVHTGIVQIFNVGSTGAIGAIEFEPGLTQDLPALLRRLIPPQPGLCPRANLARRQRPFASASDTTRSEPDSARARRQARARHLAADLSHRMRRPAP
jgi:Uncharacterised protein family UPF0047